MAYSLLSEIHKDSNHWTICVLISRMWHYRGGTDEGPIKHTDLVLLDTEGNHMYGQIPPSTVERMKVVLKEGKVFVIRKFLCNLSRPSFRPVESLFMVQFTKYTVVKERPGLEDTFPFCTYNLTAFTDIPDPSNTPGRFIDVIGKITMVSDVLPIQSMYQTKPSNTRTIILTDLLGNEIMLVLWGDRAVEFDAEAVRSMGDKEAVIAIFVGTLPKTARGVRGLSGSSACRWYIDEDIPDINTFRASLGEQFTPLAPYVPTGPDALVSRVYQDPIAKTVNDLNKVDPFEDMEKRFHCTVTISRLSSDQRWWFASCSTCRKSARHNGHQYQCSGETCSCVNALLTYCVSVFASDGTGEAEFVLFDKVAAGAIGKPLVALLRQRYPGYATVEDIANVARLDTAIPQEISRLVGQKYKLLVCISKKWRLNNSENLSFQINRIEETFKPDLPPLDLVSASGSGGPTSTASGSGVQFPPLGPVVSPMQHTPPALGSAPSQSPRPGNQSPMGQALSSPAARIAPETPNKGSSAPKRGTRRSLFASPSKVKPQAAIENDPPNEEIPAIIQPCTQDVVAVGTVPMLAISDEEKDNEILPPKLRKSAAASKTGGAGKKQKMQ